MFNVLGNEFFNLRYNGLQIIREYEYTFAKVWVTENYFHNISNTVLIMTNAGSTITSIERNKFAWNVCQKCSSTISLTLNTLGMVIGVEFEEI
jgi:predicted nucleic-acid-binding Zn-ribbon protein